MKRGRPGALAVIVFLAALAAALGGYQAYSQTACLPPETITQNATIVSIVSLPPTTILYTAGYNYTTSTTATVYTYLISYVDTNATFTVKGYRTTAFTGTLWLRYTVTLTDTVWLGSPAATVTSTSIGGVGILTVTATQFVTTTTFITSISYVLGTSTWTLSSNTTVWNTSSLAYTLSIFQNVSHTLTHYVETTAFHTTQPTLVTVQNTTATHTATITVTVNASALPGQANVTEYRPLLHILPLQTVAANTTVYVTSWAFLVVASDYTQTLPQGTSTTTYTRGV